MYSERRNRYPKITNHAPGNSVTSKDFAIVCSDENEVQVSIIRLGEITIGMGKKKIQNLWKTLGS